MGLDSGSDSVDELYTNDTRGRKIKIGLWCLDPAAALRKLHSKILNPSGIRQMGYSYPPQGGG